MNQIAITEFKKLTASEIKAQMPITITSDGVVIAVVGQPITGKLRPAIPPPIVRTKCPNCKMEYDVTPPDGKPFFFTIKHPKS